MSDCAVARRHLVFICRVKLGHGWDLCWHMFGLAHQYEDGARACVQRCLQLYEDPATRSDHWVCVAMLCLGSAGYDESVRLAAGEGRRHMPSLCLMAARFLFASVSERWIGLEPATWESSHTSAAHELSALSSSAIGRRRYSKEDAGAGEAGFSERLALPPRSLHRCQRHALTQKEVKMKWEGASKWLRKKRGGGILDEGRVHVG